MKSVATINRRRDSEHIEINRRKDNDTLKSMVNMGYTIGRLRFIQVTFVLGYNVVRLRFILLAKKCL